MSVLNIDIEDSLGSPLGDGRYDILLLNVHRNINEYYLLKGLMGICVPSVSPKDFADFVSQKVFDLVMDQHIDNSLPFDSKYHHIHYTTSDGEVFKVIVNDRAWLQILITDMNDFK